MSGPGLDELDPGPDPEPDPGPEPDPDPDTVPALVLVPVELLEATAASVLAAVQ